MRRVRAEVDAGLSLFFPAANPHNAICSAAQKIGEVACEDDFNFDRREAAGAGLGACACVCTCVLCLPMYAGEEAESIFFLATLFAFCLEEVEHGSANNVACGFISEKVIEIPRALGGVYRKSRAKWIRSLRMAGEHEQIKATHFIGLKLIFSLCVVEKLRCRALDF
jgi:hypothetical protein